MCEEAKSEYQWQNVKRQIYAALVANLVLVGHGSISGWLSPALTVLLSDETPLRTGPITNVQLSWLGSISSLGSIVGTFIFGGLSSMVGCKRAMIFLALPSITFWLLVYFGDAFYHLLCARFSMGLTAGGIQSGIIIYVSEISNNNIRGSLGSFTPLARNVGVLIAYVVGASVEYNIIPMIFIYIPLVYMICLFMLPNTPQYYLKNDNIKEAEKSLMFYKGVDGKGEQDRAAIQSELVRMSVAAKHSMLSGTIHINDFNNRIALRGIIIGIAMAWFLQMTGCFIMINYAVLMFQNMNTILDPHISSIILASVQIFGGLLSTTLSDTLGRKVMLIISLFGSAIGLFGTSLYLFLFECGFNLANYTILPVVCLSFVIFISSAGIAPLSNVCAIENLPPRIRCTGILLYTLLYNIIAFLGDKYFPILLDTIGLYGCLTIFAVNCCLGVVFVIFYMKETKGRSLNFTNSTCSIIDR